MALNLHIGLPKTGTTYLQKSFHHASPKIRQDIFYPDLGYYNHQLALYSEFNQYLPWDGSTSKTKWSDLLNTMKNANDRDTLISAEALSALNNNGVRHLSNLLNEIQIDSIVVTVRRLEKLIPSLWQQNLKKGSSTSLHAHTDKVFGEFKKSIPSTMLLYYDVIKRWRQFFPKTRVDVLFMDGDLEQNLERFATILNLSDTSIMHLKNVKLSPSEQNLSLSYEECLELLEVNGRSDDIHTITAIRKQLLKVFFNARNSGAVYEKPKLTTELTKRANEIDSYMYEKAKVLNYCNLHHGKQ